MLAVILDGGGVVPELSAVSPVDEWADERLPLVDLMIFGGTGYASLSDW
jgi:hypothetical protein